MENQNFEITCGKTLHVGDNFEVISAVITKLDLLVAIKMPKITTPPEILQYEFEVLRDIHNNIPGTNEECRRMIVPLGMIEIKSGRRGMMTTLQSFDLQKTLHALRLGGAGFLVTPAALWAKSMMEGLKNLHQAGYVHRNIWPENYLLDKPNGNWVVHMVDFKTAAKYSDEDKPNSQTKFCNYTYAAPAVHYESFYIKKYDLISWYFCIVEIFGDLLPWSRYTDKNDIYFSKVESLRNLQWQVNTNRFPELGEIREKINQLSETQEPDYDYYMQLLDQIVARENNKGSEDTAINLAPVIQNPTEEVEESKNVKPETPKDLPSLACIYNTISSDVTKTAFEFHPVPAGWKTRNILNISKKIPTLNEVSSSLPTTMPDCRFQRPAGEPPIKIPEPFANHLMSAPSMPAPSELPKRDKSAKKNRKERRKGTKKSGKEDKKWLERELNINKVLSHVLSKSRGWRDFSYNYSIEEKLLIARLQGKQTPRLYVPYCTNPRSLQPAKPASELWKLKNK